MLTFNNKIITRNDKWVSHTYIPPVYNVYVSANNGTVVAIPNSGISGTEVTLTNTPASGYTFDSYSVTGATLKNTNQFDIDGSDVYVYGKFTSPYNPLDLPPGVIRVRTSDRKPPDKSEYTTYESAVLVPGTTDVYDVYKSGTDFSNVLRDNGNVIEVLGANTSNVTNMTYMFFNAGSLRTVALFDTSKVTKVQGMFYWCYDLITIPLFDTSKVTNMQSMFGGCHALTSVPLINTSKATNMKQMFADCMSLTAVPVFDTSNVTNMSSMFINCYELITIPLFDTHKVTECSYMFAEDEKVQSGALALYQQMSTQFRPPSSHVGTFLRTGRYTTTGAAELAQIPDDWKSNGT